MSWYIKAETLKNGVLTFSNVKEYEIIDGNFLRFVDSFNGKEKIFHASRCEIEWEGDEY